MKRTIAVSIVLSLFLNIPVSHLYADNFDVEIKRSEAEIAKNNSIVQEQKALLSKYTQRLKEPLETYKFRKLGTAAGIATMTALMSGLLYGRFLTRTFKPVTKFFKRKVRIVTLLGGGGIGVVVGSPVGFISLRSLEHILKGTVTLDPRLLTDNKRKILDELKEEFVQLVEDKGEITPRKILDLSNVYIYTTELLVEALNEEAEKKLKEMKNEEPGFWKNLYLQRELKPLITQKAVAEFHLSYAETLTKLYSTRIKALKALQRQNK